MKRMNTKCIIEFLYLILFYALQEDWESEVHMQEKG